MIARQRQNLTLTFAAQDQSPAKNETIARLATNQSELYAATVELAEGLAERGADVAPLNEAAVHMQVAESTIRDGDLMSATLAEQLALASLIRARQNIRQMLSQPSSQASECRSFDKKQRDKLRTPEQKRQDQQQQLAEARAKLDQLAEQERKWSEELKQSQQPQQSQQSPNQPSQNQKPEKQDPSQSPSQSQSQSPSQSQSQSPSQSQGKPQGQSQSPSESQSPSANQSQSPSESASSTPKTPADFAREQREMQAAIDALREKIEQLGTTSEAAREQAADAAESAESSLEQLEKGDALAAADDAERTADQIERLTDHMAAMNASDVGQRLDQARQAAAEIAARQADLAEQIGAAPSPADQQKQSGSQSPDGESAGQSGRKSDSESDGNSAGKSDRKSNGKSVGKSDGKSDSRSGGKSAGTSDAGSEGQSSGGKPSGGQKLAPGEKRTWARDERDLARRVEMLSELLAGLRGDSLGEKGGLKESLETIHEQQSPGEIAGEMRQAAADLEQGRGDQAAKGAGRSRDNLQDLAKALGDLRKDFAQPQLQELLELEQQLAKLQQQLERGEKSGDSTAKSAASQAKWSELASKLDGMAAGDSRLAEAMKRLRSGANQRTPGARIEQQSADEQRPEGFQSGNKMPETSALKDVNTVVQMKIQEAILAGTLLDGDQAVPPEYRALVDEYYKALSDDLR